MPVRIVRLGTPRHPNEGVRIGTVRRPPRGVRKQDYAAGNWYDVWLPDLAPSESLLKRVRSAGTGDDAWRRFEKAYLAEMKRPEQRRLLDLLAALSHYTAFSVGCYCEDERRCHRSLLAQLLRTREAKIEK